MCSTQKIHPNLIAKINLTFGSKKKGHAIASPTQMGHLKECASPNTVTRIPHWPLVCRIKTMVKFPFFTFMKIFCLFHESTMPPEDFKNSDGYILYAQFHNSLKMHAS